MITYVDRSLLGTFRTFAKVEELSPDAFEYFSALMLEDLGYENVRVSPKHGDYKADGGIDLYANHNGNLVVGQCKHHSIRSGRNGFMKFEYVQALGGAMLRAKSPEGVFVSTLTFSKTSQEYAAAVNMLLLGPDEINAFVEKHAEKLQEESGNTYDIHGDSSKSVMHKLFPIICVVFVVVAIAYWL